VALEHNSPIRYLELSVISSWGSGKVPKALRHPFPELTHLRLPFGSVTPQVDLGVDPDSFFCPPLNSVLNLSLLSQQWDPEVSFVVRLRSSTLPRTFMPMEKRLYIEHEIDPFRSGGNVELLVELNIEHGHAVELLRLFPGVEDLHVDET